MKYDIIVSYDAGASGPLRKTRKEVYESFYVKLIEATNVLHAKFERNKQPPPLEWKLRLGHDLAQLHHSSHTWCFCDGDALIKQMNESKEPTYLGTIGGRWKSWQDNGLEPNVAILEGQGYNNGKIRRAKLTIEGLKYGD